MNYLINLAILVSIYAILALTLNLIVGYSGLLSVNHAAFFGVGAYVTAILTISYNLNFFLSIIAGMLFSAVVAALLGLVLSRFRGDYYALVSLGFNIIVYSIFLNWQSLTQGPLGIPGIKRPFIFGIDFISNFNYLILCLIFLILIYFVSKYIVNSSFGRVLKAIREDEETIKVFGYNTFYYKLLIFVLGAALASIAGSLFAAYISFIDPSTFSVTESLFILAVIILGGIANLRASILGALFLVLLPEALRFIGFPPEIAGQLRQLAYGVILVILMLYKPEGFMGQYKF
jgi:branched-chain amino acid transport system permease protein